MQIEIHIPSPGESITEVEIGNWLVKDGDIVQKDQEVGEIESDKATLPLLAEDGGQIKILKQSGETVKVGELVATIDTDKAGEATEAPKEKEAEEKTESKKENTSKPKEETAKQDTENTEKKDSSGTKYDKVKVTPVAKKLMEEQNLSVEDIIKGLERIGKKEVQQVISQGNINTEVSSLSKEPKERDENVERMSSLRRKLSKRLVSVKNETAMLTTFNEVDMSKVMALRQKYQKKFIEKHEVKLGFMSLFTKAAAIALQKFPKVNSYIDGENIVTPNYSDIGIAVQTEKGLMVPVIRNTESKGFAEIEKALVDLASKARKGRLSIEDMTGGTFTITNGGVFGSMLSTPIINPPQSAILGMHNIVERPVAVNGKVEIRPIMYVALSYDHRIIDGRESVSFLYAVKELIENPYKMLFGGNNSEELLLNL